MKRSIKAVALASALALSAGAWAATNDLIIDIHNNTAGAAITDFFVDVSAQITTAGTPLTFDLTNNAGSSANWASYYVAGDSYSFIALGMAQTGITRPGDVGFAQGAPAAPSSANLTTLAGGASHNLVLDLSTAPTVGMSLATSTPSTSFASIVGIGNDYGISPSQGNVIGTSTSPLELYFFTGPGVRTDLGALALNLGATDQSLTIAAAVPEPGTYALMVAGLLAVGAIVRRRGRG